ncbi:MAG: DUF2029 domain-containing protein [Anaerolineales bacterium]|nr:DUF2029 domain-containing protein [Anaerolineales bacterium]
MPFKLDAKELSPQEREKLILLLLLFIFAVGAAAMYWSLLVPRKDFYNELWAPTYLLLRGQSPYATAPLNPELPAAWLPMAVGFFAPLGALSESLAQRIWFLVNIAELAALVYWARLKDKLIFNLIVVCLLTFFFPSTIHHLILGQFSLTTTLCVVAGTMLVVKEKRWLGAFVLALGLTKLHLMTLSLLGLTLWSYRRGGAKEAAALILRVASACVVLCLPLFIAYPNWIPDALQSMSSNAAWTFPTLQNFFIRSLGVTAGMTLWVVAVVLIAAFALCLWTRLDPVRAAFWTLGLSLLISPYIGSWDFVALLPLLIYVYVDAGKRQKIFIVGAYLAAWVLMASGQAQTDSHNYFFWWVPLWHLAVAALTFRWRESFSRQK